MTERLRTPASAWAEIKAGNERFLSEQREHPHQDLHARESTSSGQAPIATVLGCSDSRVAAEHIFDQGLGDLFVVRTAGQVIDNSVLGSLEFGTEVLGVPLIVVLGHDSCGAVKATINALDVGDVPSGYIRDLVERVLPTVLLARREDIHDVDPTVEVHVKETVRQVMERSVTVSAAVRAGRCAIVGLVYQLVEGQVRIVEQIGDLQDAK